MSKKPKKPPCLHAKLQLQQVAPDECLTPEKPDIGAWYLCKRCGVNFTTELHRYEIKATYPAKDGAL